MKIKKFWIYKEIDIDISELEYLQTMGISRGEVGGFTLGIFINNALGNRPTFIHVKREEKKEGTE